MQRRWQAKPDGGFCRTIFALKKGNPQSAALTAPLEKEPHGGIILVLFCRPFLLKKILLYLVILSILQIFFAVCFRLL